MNGARRRPWPWRGRRDHRLRCRCWAGRWKPGANCGNRGIAATVISNPFVNRVDVETIGAAVRNCSGRVVTIEDHQAICGMGAQVAHAVVPGGNPHRMKTLAIRGEFGQSAYLAEDLYKRHGLTSAKIVEAAQELMR